MAQQPRVRTYEAQPLALVTPVASEALPVEQEVTNVHEVSRSDSSNGEPNINHPVSQAILAITYRLSDKFERSLEQPRG